MGMAEPATREDMRRHPNDPLKGIAFVDELPNGKLTTQPIGKHVATIDLEVWFSHLLQHGEAEVCPGWKVKLERVDEVWSGTGLEAVELLADHLQFGGEQAAEADRIVRELARAYLPTSAGLEAIGLLKAAVMHVAKYPKGKT